MNATVHRLEDDLTEWRGTLLETLSARGRSITETALEALRQAPGITEEARRGELTRSVEASVRDFTSAELLPQSLNWLSEQGVEVALPDRVRADVDLAIRRWSPGFAPYLPPPEIRIPLYALPIAASAGAALGSLPLLPLSWLMFQGPAEGLFFGGCLGAGGTVALISWLSTRPKILTTLQTVVAGAGILTALGGVVQVIKSQKLGFLKGAVWIFGCWLVLLLARPRTTPASRDRYREALLPQVEAKLAEAAELVLALVFAHPDREERKADTEKLERPASLPSSLADALGVLLNVFEDGQAPAPRPLAGAIKSVLLRVRELGYEWESIPSGTLYCEDFDGRFECFDIVVIGQPVETLKPALVRRGQVVELGMLRSHSG